MSQSTPSQTRSKESWEIHAAGVSACVVLSVLFCLAGLRPILSERRTNALQEAKLQEQRQQETKRRALITTLRQDIVLAHKALDEMPLRLKPAGHVNQRLARLTDLATANGLDIHEIQPEDAASGTHYDTVPVRLAGKGTYQTHTAFLRNLHQTFRDTAVTSFQLVGNPRQPDEPATFRMTLAWYTSPAGISIEK